MNLLILYKKILRQFCYFYKKIFNFESVQKNVLSISLKKKLILPLILFGAMFAVINTFGSYFQFKKNLQEQVQKRAAYLANTLVYVAQFGDISALQRMVFSIGGEWDVDQVVICQGSDMHIIASNHYEWVGEYLRDISDTRVIKKINKIYHFEKPQGFFERKDSNFYYGMQFNMPSDKGVDLNWEKLRSSVYIKLVTTGIEQAQASQELEDTLLALGGIIGVSGIGYLLITLFVIRPLERIRKSMDARKMGKHTERAPIIANDEIGDLAKSLNAMIIAEEESQLLFKTLANAAPVLIWMLDIDQRPYYFNHEWIRFKKSTLEEELGKEWTDDIFDEDRHFILNTFQVHNHQIFSGEFRLRNSEGVYRWMLYKMVPIIGGEGLFDGYIGVCVDITERKEAEKALSIARDQALELAKTKSRFLATISHEIRTPMNGVIGFSNLLKKTSLDKLQGDYLKNIETSGKVLLGLLNDILDFSKLEAGKMELESTAFNLQDTLESVYNMFYAQALEKNLSYKLCMHQPLPEIVMGDSVRFRQIIINLLSNAIKFTHSGSVLLQVYAKPMYHEKQQGFQVMIMVEDTGIGIPPEKQQKIFEPFCQVDASTTREYGGTGLGLTIVHALISAMGGSLQVRSSVGVGTTFTISCWMPISQKKSKTLQYVSLDV